MTPHEHRYRDFVVEIATEPIEPLPRSGRSWRATLVALYDARRGPREKVRTRGLVTFGLSETEAVDDLLSRIEHVIDRLIRSAP